MVLLLGMVLVPAHAQTNAGEKVAAGIAAGIGLFEAIRSIDAYYEMLELQATQEVLKEYPGEQSFRVKVLKKDGQKVTDISRETMIVFLCNFYDSRTQNETRREALFALASPGWINEYGIEFSKLEWMWFGRDRWNQMMGEFVRISTPVSPQGGKVPSASIIDESEYVGSPNQFFIKRMGDNLTEKYDFYQVSVDSFPISSISMGTKEFLIRVGNPLNGFYRELPSYDIGRDQYVAGSFEDDITLVANEGALGLYRSSVGRLVQFRRAVVNTIHEWINTTSIVETNSIETLAASNRTHAESIAQANQIQTNIQAFEMKNKNGFFPGDKGYYKVNGEWIPCTVENARIDIESKSFWVSIKIEVSGVEQTETIKSNNSKVIWVSQWVDE